MLGTRLLTLLAIALLASLSTGATWGATPPATALGNCFENANTEGYPDGSVRLFNQGATGANVCANIYVFNPDQEMVECCACTLKPHGLTTFDQHRLDEQSDNTGCFGWGWRDPDRIDSDAVQPDETYARGDGGRVGNPRPADWGDRDGIHSFCPYER